MLDWLLQNGLLGDHRLIESGHRRLNDLLRDLGALLALLTTGTVSLGLLVPGLFYLLRGVDYLFIQDAVILLQQLFENDELSMGQLILDCFKGQFVVLVSQSAETGYGWLNDLLLGVVVLQKVS